MAATIGTLPVKILAQVGDGEPIEIGTYDIPISIGGGVPGAYRGGDARVQLDMGVYSTGIDQAARALARQTAVRGAVHR